MAATPEDIVDGTVGDAKDALEDYSGDLDAVLQAEKEGKNRKTLIQHIENLQEESASETSAPAAPRSGDAVSLSPGSILGNVKAVFFIGLVIGGLVALGAGSSLFAADTQTPSISQAEAESAVSTYLDDNREAFGFPAELSYEVTDVTAESESLYAVTLSLSFQGQSQDVPAYVTRDGSYLFMSQPIDLTTPLDQQVPQQPAPQQQQQAPQDSGTDSGSTDSGSMNDSGSMESGDTNSTQ